MRGSAEGHCPPSPLPPHGARSAANCSHVVGQHSCALAGGQAGPWGGGGGLAWPCGCLWAGVTGEGLWSPFRPGTHTASGLPSPLSREHLGSVGAGLSPPHRGLSAAPSPAPGLLLSCFFAFKSLKEGFLPPPERDPPVVRGLCAPGQRGSWWRASGPGEPQGHGPHIAPHFHNDPESGFI